MASFVDVQLVLKMKHSPRAPDFNVSCRMPLRGCEISSRKRLNCEPNSHQINIEVGGAGGRKHLQSNTVHIEFTCEINSVNSRQEEVQWVRYSYSSLTYMQVLYGMSADD